MTDLATALLPDGSLPRLRLMPPPHLFDGSTDTAVMLSAIARLVASGAAETKPELMAATGLARSTVTVYVETLLRRGVLAVVGSQVRSGRGRPAERLGLGPGAGLVVVVDIGARRTRLAVCHLDQRTLATRLERLDVREGPEPVLARITEIVDEMLAEVGGGLLVRNVIVGVPARVDMVLGVPIRPNIMLGWHGYPVARELGRHLRAPTVLENDVNLRALGESAVLAQDERPLLAIKVGTGVGAGIVDGSGRLFRGFDGAAGDIGHIAVRRAPAVRCGCGTTGCVETVISVPALVGAIRAERAGLIAEDLDERDERDQLTDLLRRGDPTAIRVARDAAEALGEAVADLCNILNPRRIVIGGAMTEATDEILAGVRAVAYQTARPQATRNLIISHSMLGQLAGMAGALVLGIETALSPEGLAGWAPGE